MESISIAYYNLQTLTDNLLYIVYHQPTGLLSCANIRG